MIIFLTSSPTGNLDGTYSCEGFDNRNGFADYVRSVWRKDKDVSVLMITAFPDDRKANEEMGAFFHEAILKTGLSCSRFDLWDNRILEKEEYHSKEILQLYDVIMLGGGHVPTQMEFFNKLNLKDSMEGYNGIVIGISAGSMNSAYDVYSIPEEKGEAVDPEYQRFFKGIGITDISIIPHYNMFKDGYLDGLHLYNDIAIPDSAGRKIITFPDGSYVVDWKGMTLLGNGQWVEPQSPEVFGEAYILENGSMRPYYA